MKYLNPIKELAVDLLNIHEHFQSPNENIEIKIFFQIWPSTSLGFNGAGGDSLTTATTIVVFKKNIANVFFGGKLAYRIPMQQNGEFPVTFMQDLKNEALCPVSEYEKRYTPHGTRRERDI